MRSKVILMQLIAVFCWERNAFVLQHGLALATSDEHFSNISSLLLAIR